MRVRHEMHARVAHRVPLRLLGHGLPAEQAQDHVERLGHPIARGLRLDAHHQGIGCEQAGASAEHDPAPSHVVELDDAVRHVERVVIRERHDAGAEAEVLGPFGRGGDEDLGRVDRLHTGGVVLTDPGFREAQSVEHLQQLEIALEAQRGVLVEGVERCEEDAVPEIHAQSAIIEVGPRLCPTRTTR